MSKPIYYTCDGKGRDSYISINNGGLNRPFEPNIYEVGTFNQRHTKSYQKCSIEPKKLYYTSNGTGRDSYIVASSGGLVSSGFHRDIYTNGFLDTLRTPRKPQTPIERCRSSCKTKKEKADYYMRTQTYTSAKQREASNTFRKYQLKRDLLLSKPKKLTKKYTTVSVIKLK